MRIKQNNVCELRNVQDYDHNNNNDSSWHLLNVSLLDQVKIYKWGNWGLDTPSLGF